MRKAAVAGHTQHTARLRRNAARKRVVCKSAKIHYRMPEYGRSDCSGEVLSYLLHLKKPGSTPVLPNTGVLTHGTDLLTQAGHELAAPGPKGSDSNVTMRKALGGIGGGFGGSPLVTPSTQPSRGWGMLGVRSVLRLGPEPRSAAGRPMGSCFACSRHINGVV